MRRGHGVLGQRRYLSPLRDPVSGAETAETEYDLVVELRCDGVDMRDGQRDAAPQQEATAAFLAAHKALVDPAKSRCVLVEDRGDVSATGPREDEAPRALGRLVDKDEIVDLVHRRSHLVGHKRYEHWPAQWLPLAPGPRGGAGAPDPVGSRRSPPRSR